MANSLLIAVDSGKYATKARYKGGDFEDSKKMYFRTKVQEIDKGLSYDIKGGDIIEYNNKTYIIGDSVSEKRANYDVSKDTTEHLVCIYLAISKAIEKLQITANLIRINLAVNVPINIYQNVDLKEQYANHINNNKIIHIKHNGKQLHLLIDNLILLPEGMADIYTNLSKYRTTKNLVLDIGGLNTTYCVYKGIVPQIDTMILANTGGNIIRSKIASALSKQYGIVIAADDLEQIIKDSFLSKNGVVMEDSHDLILKVLTEHVNEIINFAKSHDISFYNTNVIICGGGSQLLKKVLLSKIPNANIVEDGAFSNVNSFFTILDVKING